jgi:aspartyl protease family protein
MVSSCSRCGESTNSSRPNSTRKSNRIKMRKEGGVYYIPIIVNGSKMEFIFDTGASIISISQTEANYLYKQGTLTQDDFIGTQDFIDANGDISQGLLITLDKVQIGNRTLRNIEASIVNNTKAPLLLGQSVLGKFGSFTIDNKRGYLIIN